MSDKTKDIGKLLKRPLRRRELIKGGIAGAALIAGSSIFAPRIVRGAGGSITIGSFQDNAMAPFRDYFVKAFTDETGIAATYNETNYDSWYQSCKNDGLNKTGAYDIYVMVDDAEPGIVDLAQRRQHHRRAAVQQQRRQRRSHRNSPDDDAIDATFDQGARDLLLDRRRAFRVRRQHRIAVGVRRALHADGELGVERIREVRHDEADRRAGTRLQRARDCVGVIAGFRDHPFHALARRLGNERGAADDVRYRRLRHAGAPGDIKQRGHAATASCASARCRPAIERFVPSSPS